MATRKTAAPPAPPAAEERPRKGHRRGLPTDELLLVTAEQLFAKQGYEAVSTKQLAAEAGVTIGALYHHFPSKQAVYDAVTARAFSRKGELPQQLLDSKAPAEAQLVAMLTWFLGNLMTDRQFGTLLQRELLDPRSSEPGRLFTEYFREPHARFRVLLKQMLPRANLDVAVASLMALCFGFANLKGLNTLAPSLGKTLGSPEAIAKQALRLLVAGVQDA